MANAEEALVATEVVTPNRGPKYFIPHTLEQAVVGCCFRDDFHHRDLKVTVTEGAISFPTRGHKGKPSGLWQWRDAEHLLFPSLHFGKIPADEFSALASHFLLLNGGFAFTLSHTKAELRQHEANLFADLTAVGGDIPEGFPNSRKEGMHRGNGLFAGQFVAGLHKDKAVRNIALVALEQRKHMQPQRKHMLRKDATLSSCIESRSAKSSSGDLLLQPGPLLFTTTEHQAYAGNKKTHNDAKTFDSGNIKLLICLTKVHPMKKSHSNASWICQRALPVL